MSYKILVVCLLALFLVNCGSSPKAVLQAKSAPVPANGPVATPITSADPAPSPTPSPTPAPSPSPGSGNSNPVPTTTLSAQTANNTSASDTFPSQANGNLGANNVSKMNIHSLLYPGATTKVLAHLLLWFGDSRHMNVGYNSADANQVKRQIEDMISRGIDGVVLDWYGPNNSIDDAAKMVMHEAEKHANFSFVIMIDAGAVGSNLCNGCSPQNVLVNLLQYVEKTYFPSNAYMNIGGQPIVTNFNIDNQYAVDWQSANGQLKTPPRFFFQDNPGFSHSMSDGSYSWIMPQESDEGLGYLSNFYYTGLGFMAENTVGASYKGFNDQLASWGSNRRMDQQCGQTWLKTFSAINSIYNQGTQLPYLQLVTWNDYEEGTEIESGVDNCFSLQTSISGNSLQWKINGDESTVDHYSVYSSTDGQNLAQLTQLGVGTHSVDLCSLNLGPDNYQLYVQAVGKPSMANRMPGALSYTPSCK